jgi:hypothetical protein
MPAGVLPDRYGIAEAFPTGFGAQLMHPFKSKASTPQQPATVR